MKLSPDMSWKEALQVVSVLTQWAARRRMRLRSFVEVAESLKAEGLSFDLDHAQDATAASEADQERLENLLGKESVRS